MVLGPFVPGLVPMAILQESFELIVSYRRYRLVDIHHNLSFEDVYQLAIVGKSIRSSFQKKRICAPKVNNKDISPDVSRWPFTLHLFDRKVPSSLLRSSRITRKKEEERSIELEKSETLADNTKLVQPILAICSSICYFSGSLGFSARNICLYTITVDTCSPCSIFRHIALLADWSEHINALPIDPRLGDENMKPLRFVGFVKHTALLVNNIRIIEFLVAKETFTTTVLKGTSFTKPHMHIIRCRDLRIKFRGGGTYSYYRPIKGGTNVQGRCCWPKFYLSSSSEDKSSSFGNRMIDEEVGNSGRNSSRCKTT